MKLNDIFEVAASDLDKPTLSAEQLASKYNRPLDEIKAAINKGIKTELEHTSDPNVAEEIALDHLGERLDYYDELAKVEKSNTFEIQYLPEEIGMLDEVYPGQSSGKLKNYVRKKYGGEIGCGKVARLINDPSVSKFYKKRAIWYKSLHCRGTKQIREEDPQMPNVGAALTIWDIDNTLFKTAAQAVVKRSDGSTFTLSPEEYNSYQLKPGESFDMSQFQNAKLFYDTSKPIANIWRTAQTVLQNIGKRPGSRMVVVTARSDLDNKDLFLNTFRKHGMDMSKVHVYRAGNISSGNSAMNKQTVIRNLLNAGNYTEVRLFDDNYDNQAAFLRLKLEFPEIQFKAYPVHKSGRIGNPIIL
jgi:hypothetical protein